MLKYVLVRIGWIFIILYIILSMNFILLKLAPSYPPADKDQRDIYYARQVLDGYMTMDIITDQATINEYKAGNFDRNSKYYYQIEDDQVNIYIPVPISIQYFKWLENVLTKWDWGVSTRIEVNAPAFDVLKSRIPVTLRLNFIALFVYIPIGFLFGIVAALKSNTAIDNIISFFVMIFISVPSFVLMMLLLLLFGYALGWVPTQFPASNINDLGLQIRGLILPVLGLSFGSIAGLTRLTRAELKEVLTSEFLLLARTKGLTKNQSVIRHGMRNSMVPLVPSIIGSFVGLLSGSVIIEQIYGIPGTGRIFIRAMASGNYDYNVLLTVTAFYTIISLLAILLVDLSYGIVDPRIRMGARK
ncbi:ABC transporter permease [Acholeplasma granularum]|uniref:ABC transporter permease n=1 Tax=Acholeplasma granularum TaxID=264635 RepID=UPI000471FACA|nr:ABC transporter permease [Acholeplasma granularum]